MKIWNQCVCISKKHYIILIAILISSGILLASVYTEEQPIEDLVPPMEETKDVKVWIPTKEDIAYQDSMYSIIQNTQKDVDTIKADIDRILYKLERIEYSDGTSDSIRYVKGSAMDKKLNQ